MPGLDEIRGAVCLPGNQVVGLVQPGAREPTKWGGADGFLGRREREKIEGTARGKCTDSSALGRTRVEFALEQWSPTARQQTCASRLGSQEPHRWWRLAGGSFRGRLPCVGAVTAHIGDRAGVRPQPCCSLAEASGQRSNGFRPPFVLASAMGSLQQWGAGDRKSSRCHP